LSGNLKKKKKSSHKVSCVTAGLIKPFPRKRLWIILKGWYAI